MWLSDRREFLGGMLAGGGALALSGCGFRPVYGSGGPGRALRGAVRLADPVSRADYQFVAAFEESLGRPDAARFDLAYTIAQREVGGGVLQDFGATRVQIFGTVDFTVTEPGTGIERATGRIEANTVYSTTGTQLASLTAAEDAQLRLMRMLADGLVTRLYTEPGLAPGMKLAPRDAAGYLNRPDPRRPGILIYGADPMRVADRRARLVSTVVGPQGDSEMRLTRMPGAELRRHGAAVGEAIKAQGFFPGPRAVVIDDATDTAADALAAALADWAEGDALLIVTAGALTPGSKLRKLFEGDRRAYALAIYDDPPSPAEIEAMLRTEGLIGLPADAMRDLTSLALTLEPGDFRQTLTRIALYKYGDPAPLTPAEIALLAPQSAEADIDDVLAALAEGRIADLAPILSRLAAQGVQPVTVCIGAVRHFRLLHALVSAPGGPSQGIGSLRPPVFGPRRDRLLKQAQMWTLERVEEALRDLTATDLALRSSPRAPTRALAERALIRLARLAGRR